MIDYSSFPHPQHSNVLILEATGRIDSVTADYVLDCIQGFIDEGHTRIVIDCSNVEMITSLGLAMLVRANSRLKSKEGEIAIAGASGIVAETLRIVHFDRLFHLFENADAAAAALAD